MNVLPVKEKNINDDSHQIQTPSCVPSAADWFVLDAHAQGVKLRCRQAFAAEARKNNNVTYSVDVKRYSVSSFAEMSNNNAQSQQHIQIAST